ncbi:hypothetical protein ACGF5O_25090 [Streptomyces sp. NPDC048291]|uniref:hypothetical protein n=1 Tax=Streptomyces sp. NPDC048291 TaxID=3365530 RepID=UPI00371B2B79
MPYGTDSDRFPAPAGPPRGPRQRWTGLRLRKGSGQPHSATALPKPFVLPPETADRAFDAPRAQSRWAEGTADGTAVHGDTVELTGRHRTDRAVDRQLPSTLRDFTVRRVRPDHRLDQALGARDTVGNIGDRSRVELLGCPLVLIEGPRLRNHFRGWSVHAYDDASGRAGRLGPRAPGGSRAYAGPQTARLTDPDGRAALLGSVFIPKEECVPGESGGLVYWREL